MRTCTLICVRLILNILDVEHRLYLVHWQRFTISKIGFVFANFLKVLFNREHPKKVRHVRLFCSYCKYFTGRHFNAHSRQNENDNSELTRQSKRYCQFHV